MRTKYRISLFMVVVLFYFVDLVTTYIGLQNGAIEVNTLLRYVGFSGTVILKTMYVVLFYITIRLIEASGMRLDNKSYLSGIVTGSVIMIGVMVILINTGLFNIT
ncbi:MAG TPA: hypothetical protein HA257_05300 [Candidatus Methanoperedenaceae archaeon]|nr:hypothetical protein [Candidatus Methanoperedenaceae archaeon]